MTKVVDVLPIMYLPTEIIEIIALMSGSFTLALLVRSKTLAAKIRFNNRRLRLCALIELYKDKDIVVPLTVDDKQRNEILAFLCDVLPIETDRQRVLRHLAMHLRRGRGESMIWFGTGANGKSTLLSLALAALGTMVTHAPDRFVLNHLTSRLAKMNFTARPRGCVVHHIPDIAPNDMMVTCLSNVYPLNTLRRRSPPVVVTFPTQFLASPRSVLEKRRDDCLYDRVKTWGPQFLLILIEV